MVECDLCEGQHTKKNTYPQMTESSSKISVAVQIGSYWNENGNGDGDGEKMNAPICCMMQPAFSDPVCSASEEKKEAQRRGILGKLAWKFGQHANQLQQSHPMFDTRVFFLLSF